MRGFAHRTYDRVRFVGHSSTTVLVTSTWPMCGLIDALDAERVALTIPR